MNRPFLLIYNLGLIAVAMLIAVVIRRFFPFVRKFRIPDAIIAGFIALILGPSVLNIIPTIKHAEFVMNPLQTEDLMTIVYHLMGIGFIALALKSSEGKGRTRSAVSAGFYMVVSYAIQGLIGLGLGLILIITLFPDLFPSFGFLLPFGFAQGPSLAGQTASEWGAIINPATGGSALPGGTSVGLSFSTIGFLWACLVGVPLMNLLIRRRRRRGEPEPGFGQPPPPQEPARFLVEKERDYSGMARSIDKATTQLMLVGGVYLVLFFALKGFTALINQVMPGPMGQNILRLFWGFHFGWGALIGTFLGKIIRKMEEKRWIKGNRITSNYLLQHIGGTAIDFLIAASIAAINIRVLWESGSIVPILIITTIGGLVTIGYVWVIARTVWPRTYVEHFVTLFGTHTGTLATGMALLRGVDPQFRTSAASDVVYGSGIGLMMGVPLIVIAGIPATGYETGRPQLYWQTILWVLAYLAVAIGAWTVFLKLTRHRQKVMEDR